jgi:hypothetical protein
VGIDPKLSDAELVTLAVMQGLSGFTSEDPVAAVRMRFTCGTCSLPAAAARLQQAPAPVRDGRGRLSLLAGAFSLSCAAGDRAASPTRLAWFHQLRRSRRMRRNDGGPWTLAGELR